MFKWKYEEYLAVTGWAFNGKYLGQALPQAVVDARAAARAVLKDTGTWGSDYEVTLYHKGYFKGSAARGGCFRQNAWLLHGACV